MDPGTAALKREYVRETPAAPPAAKAAGPRRVLPRCRQLCFATLRGEECARRECKNFHSVEEFMKVRPKDRDMGCHFFDTYGRCPHGVNCVFGRDHVGPSGSVVKAGATDPPPLLNTVARPRIAELRKLLQARRRKRKQGGRADDTSLAPRPDVEPLDLSGKLVLAPMCTVGHPPFRRLCVDFGADVTMSEMTLARGFINGVASEYARVRRHPSERLFGVQLSGTPRELELMAPVLGELAFDFADLNCSCPDASVVRQKSGSHLLRSNALFSDAVTTMSRLVRALERPRPYTVKMRAGIKSCDGFTMEARLAAAFAACAQGSLAPPAAVFAHGRVAEVHHARRSDWDVLRRAGALCHEHGAQLVGSGDIFHAADTAPLAWPEVDAVMVGRAALYKPWVFREIREGRAWDPSSSERVDILRRFGGYLLDHFGSDLVGAERARTAFLENWAYMHRYIPPALLERPQALNDRAPRFEGRDAMETLLGSAAPADWLRVSELLFGRVPDGFRFAAKK
eukprot:gnl/Chilomastix_cuspidata/726.p3 GENE.gnl/Chilomastix_cuspidata/726~~gnl/Chilomastix_cuspidata/726.p3  ORF type:complete len:512 (+),score=234.38 gnl/Chilomastix_cuspidata/726:1945-3480(+)